MKDIKNKIVYIRFYEELNDFLPEELHKKRFEHKYLLQTSVKDLIESYNVPHIEVDLVLVNGKSINFNYLINDGDDISVYPVFESFDVKDVQHLRAAPLRDSKFVVDVHLGSLARYLRMAGMDTTYKTNNERNEIIDLSLQERRCILTKNVELLKNNKITHGYFVRSEEVEKQLIEVINRFQLSTALNPFSRCMDDNTLLEDVEKEKIISFIPEKVKQWHNEFKTCPACKKIYWKGSHYQKMKDLLDRIS